MNSIDIRSRFIAFRGRDPWHNAVHEEIMRSQVFFKLCLAYDETYTRLPYR